MRILARIVACVLAFPIAPLASGAAGDYSISPLRIELDRNARSGGVTLGNTGDEAIDFQISVMEWTQGDGGRDAYAPTTDIVFFPRILNLKAGENRVIRVGVQTPPPAVERTYRIFVEPIPKRTQEPLPPGASVAVTLRFALPIFVKPAVPHASGDIEGASLRGGKLSLAVRNTGNEPLRFDEGMAVVGLDASGSEILSRKIEFRYLLAGTTRPLSLAIPKDVCERLSSVEVTARAEQVVLSQKLAASRASCE
jgi:fimbrial chaperone protein